MHNRIITAALFVVATVHALVLRAWPHFWSWFVGRESAPESAPAAVDNGRPAVDYASLLEVLTVRDLRQTCVTLGLPSKAYRSARKADLVAMLAELSVNPTL
jgi:hypothetical protein